jgi:hypothetical protein
MGWREWYSHLNRQLFYCVLLPLVAVRQAENSAFG